MGRSEEKNRKWGGHSGSSYWTDVLSISESAVTKGESLQPEPTRRASWQNAATTQIWAGEGVSRKGTGNLDLRSAGVSLWTDPVGSQKTRSFGEKVWKGHPLEQHRQGWKMDLEG